MKFRMGMNRILFMSGEGIGNVVQTIPTIRTLVEVLGYRVDFLHLFGSYPIPTTLIPYVDNFYTNLNNIFVPSDYCGKVATFWARNHLEVGLLSRLPLLNKIKPLSMDRSEVNTYMDIARDLGVDEKDILWHGKCNYKEMAENYDVVIHNGYNEFGSANWRIKSYPAYNEVASLLNSAGFRVCSVGSTNEYIANTFNLTGLNLLDSLGIIKNSKLLLSNDSGLYHCANALQKKNIVIFTATSITKNYDERFHKYSKLLFRDDLKCRPCQSTRGWKNCNTWDCQKLDPNDVFTEVVKHLGEGNGL